MRKQKASVFGWLLRKNDNPQRGLLCFELPYIDGIRSLAVSNAPHNTNTSTKLSSQLKQVRLIAFFAMYDMAVLNTA